MAQKIMAILSKADVRADGGLTATTLRPVLLEVGCSAADIDLLLPSCADEAGRIDITAFIKLLYGDTHAASVVSSCPEGRRQQTGKVWTLRDLDLSNEPALRLREDPISFDGQVQYGGRTPEEELEHLEQGEAAAYAQALAENGLPASTTDYPRVTSAAEAAGILAKIRENAIKLWDGSGGGRVVPAVSKGFDGSSELHVASLPGADGQVYNNAVLCSLEEKLSFGVVWEANWKDLWFCVWKLRQREALQSGKHFLVLTKDDGSIGFNQSLEVTYLRRERISFHHMTSRSFLRQLRPMIHAACYQDDETVGKLLDGPEAKELLQQRDFSGYTTLHILAMDGKVELTRRALAIGAGLDAPNFAGGTPLLIAADRGHEETVRVLLEARAAVDAANNAGCTPLCQACQEGQEAVATALLAARADFNLRTQNNATPLDIARTSGHRALVQRLLVAVRADASDSNPRRRLAPGTSVMRCSWRREMPTGLGRRSLGDSRMRLATRGQTEETPVSQDP